MRIANDRVVCCIQIETSEAMADLDAILAVPGIDTILIGPNDLSAALGHIGDLAHADVEAAIATVLGRATAQGIPAGIWTGSIAQARARREQGFRWATLGTDYGFMVAGADAAARDVRAP
jgi:2-keto-3-deoxy-L-rhamnonate aldolase RhmA